MEFQDLIPLSQFVYTPPRAPESLPSRAVEDARHTADNALKKVEQLTYILRNHGHLNKVRGDDVEYVGEGRARCWIPWLVCAVAVNILLWLSMLYAVFRIQDYAHIRRHYLTTAWLIFAIPLFAIVFLITTPYPDSLKRKRIALVAASKQNQSKSSRHILNLVNALFCFTIVVLYIYVSAIPQYNRARWENSVDFQESLPIPSFAIIFYEGSDYSGIPNINLKDTPEGYKPVCQVLRGSSMESDVFPDSALQYTTIGNKNALVVNTSRLSSEESYSTSLHDQIVLNFFVDYNSTFKNGNTASADDISQLFLGVVFFDPRTGLQDVWDCGFAVVDMVPALASSTFSLSVEYITDAFGLLNTPSTSQHCSSAYKSLLSFQDPPYSSYSYTIDSSLPSAANAAQSCDVATNPDNSCLNTFIFSFESHVVRSTESTPGISKGNIWINAGAIVGGVQFFAWLLGAFIG